MRSGPDVDFGQLVKVYTTPGTEEQRCYSPPKCKGRPPGPGQRRARRGVHLDELHRAAEPQPADGHPAVHPAHERLLEEARDPCLALRAVLRVVQLVPSAHDTANNAGLGGRADGHLARRRVVGGDGGRPDPGPEKAGAEASPEAGLTPYILGDGIGRADRSRMGRRMDLDARFWLVAVSIIGAVVAISRWSGRVDTRLEKLESFMKSVTKDIKKILQLMPQPEVVGASPLKLTELGRPGTPSESRQQAAVRGRSVRPGVRANQARRRDGAACVGLRLRVREKADRRAERAARRSEG